MLYNTTHSLVSEKVLGNACAGLMHSTSRLLGLGVRDWGFISYFLENADNLELFTISKDYIGASRFPY
ncbi:hypothetical protein CASFOL_021149 [Castilleja foliolosa]|uniref:Uncharacterized protein n=1 Tax=Castilleja foliolosa TaxID=1961234 RepID=A0ABD3CVQ2_9LAMI